jgi:hypothetical protein
VEWGLTKAFVVVSFACGYGSKTNERKRRLPGMREKNVFFDPKVCHALIHRTLKEVSADHCR